MYTIPGEAASNWVWAEKWAHNIGKTCSTYIDRRSIYIHKERPSIHSTSEYKDICFATTFWSPLAVVCSGCQESIVILCNSQGQGQWCKSGWAPTVVQDWMGSYSGARLDGLLQWCKSGWAPTVVQVWMGSYSGASLDGLLQWCKTGWAPTVVQVWMGSYSGASLDGLLQWCKTGWAPTVVQVWMGSYSGASLDGLLQWCKSGRAPTVVQVWMGSYSGASLDGLLCTSRGNAQTGKQTQQI